MSRYYIIAIFSVCLASVAQLLLKRAASSPAFADALAEGRPAEAARFILLLPSFLGGMVLFGVSVCAWIVVLSRIPVSQAYPLVAVGIGLTAFFGHVALGEPMPPIRIAAIVLIAVGVFLLSRT